MTQLSRHGQTAREYWETYRPQALESLGSPEQQDAYFRELDLRVTERIGQVTTELLQKLPVEQRAAARRATRSRAEELVYAEEIWLEKEPGTEHREM
ncbi:MULTISPECIES: hypothetical protein [Streptomyces]|uniref:hypothetical protein n=1 Tax=Streptomyces TaxID=1883 RepID=UPI00073E022C|nr:hypothetical protein [Streptomyces sp. FBKL.4005]OYP10268.1 hypothetical protein CFC35_41505 [Streptomyces sp. FBKL.4005]CUW33407.1 hypothetical protein TUE45_pSRTUE45a_0039 [Streptomyces reticuli]